MRFFVIAVSWTRNTSCVPGTTPSNSNVPAASVRMESMITDEPRSRSSTRTLRSSVSPPMGVKSALLSASKKSWPVTRPVPSTSNGGAGSSAHAASVANPMTGRTQEALDCGFLLNGATPGPRTSGAGGVRRDEAVVLRFRSAEVDGAVRRVDVCQFAPPTSVCRPKRLARRGSHWWAARPCMRPNRQWRRTHPSRRYDPRCCSMLNSVYA